MVGRLLVGFVWLNLQFSVSWQVDFQWGSCGSILVFCVMVGRLLVGFVWLNIQFSVSWLVDFQWGSCGSIFMFSVSWWQTFSGVRVAQSLVFCVMVGRLLVGFVWLNFSFLCHGWQTFSGVRVAQYLVFCVMVGRLLVGFVWLNLYVFCVMVGRLLVGSVWLNLQFSVSWLVDFQWGSCGSIFRVFCVMVGRLLVGFVWLNLQFSVSWLVDFQWGSCGSIFSCLCHDWQTFSGVRVAQSLLFCVMVGRLLVGFAWLNLQFSVSWLVDFQWGSCGSIFSFLCQGWRLLMGFVWLNLQFSVSWLVDFYWGSCGSIFSFVRHGWHTFSGVRVSQSLVFCVMVGRLLVGLVWLKLQFSLSWQVDFQWGSCGPIFSFLCHGWQTFSGVRESQSLVFCVKVGDFQWGSCGSIFTFLSHGWQTVSGFVWLNIQISVS